MESIQEIANNILASAKQSADEIIQEAKSSADEIRKNAFDLGYEDGLKSAKESVKEAIKNAEVFFENALKEVTEIKDKILSQAEDDIIQLTIEISKKLVCNELRQNPESLIAIIKESIKSAKVGNEITIKVNPKDLQVLEEYGSQLIEHIRSSTFGNSIDLKIEEDPKINFGGCMIITDTNILDLTFETRLNSLIDAMLNKELLIEDE